MTNLKKTLKEQGRSIRWLSNNIDVSYQVVANWARGRTNIRIDKLKEIADILKVEVSDIID